MSSDIFHLNQQAVRGTDSNSLLRLLDQVNGILSNSPSQQQRMKADKVVERVSKELQRRRVVL